MKFLINYILILSIFMIPSNLMSSLAIEKYDHERDFSAIEKILKDHYADLCYEALGCPDGTTVKYLNSNKYITDVIRVDNKTVGFVNYIVHDIKILTFQISRSGILHLIGVDSDYQRKGYGKKLVEHAIQQMELLYAPSIFLTTKVTNNARALYENSGFELSHSDGTNCYYIKKLNIPKDKLPQGNIIQRNKKIMFAIVGILSTLVLYKIYLKN